MISLILLVSAAVFKAIADTLAHHFDTSIFRRLDRKFWDGGDTYSPKHIPFTKYPLDAWHLSNSLYIFTMIMAMVLFKPVINWLPVLSNLTLFSITFVIVFNTFYNRILR